MKSFKVCTFYLALLLSSSQRMAQYWHVKQTRTVTISHNITVVKPEEEKDHLRDLDFDEGKITSANLNLKYRLLGCKLDSTQHMIKSSDGSFLTLKIKLRDSWKAPITVLREFTNQKKQQQTWLNNTIKWQRFQIGSISDIYQGFFPLSQRTTHNGTRRFGNCRFLSSDRVTLTSKTY